MGRALAVLGTGSGVGKSLLVTALARWFARQGVRVAPFKAQNMSNHARVADGGEIGAAQYYQALAAGVRPEVRMNPVLLKPEGETKSQVVVLGRMRPELARVPWKERRAHLWPAVEASLKALLAEYELVLIEGAGSPAEINLMGSDVTNLAVARAADAPILLVADIDKGGAFAQLYGTWALVPEADRRRFLAFVLNKFRGEKGLLSPAPEMLWTRTGMAPAGVLPLMPHRLPDEDAPRLGFAAPGPARGAVVAYPYAANLDEFWPLNELLGVRFVRDPAALSGAELVVLPGAKNVGAALDWLFQSGVADAIRAAAEKGVPVLGICGGLQVLGERVLDPLGLEFWGEKKGLGLLPVETVLEREKTVQQSRVRFSEVGAPFDFLSGLAFSGYEIHLGRTRATGEVRAVLPGGLGFQKGNVLGLYLHGIFEDEGVQKAWFGRRANGLEATFEALADAVEGHLDTELLKALAHEGQRAKRPPPKARYLLLGGAKSGKSRLAVALARRLGGEAVTFVATARATDAEMEERIRRHQAERPSSWQLVETPRDPAAALWAAGTPVVVLDCVSVWVANVLVEEDEAALEKELAALIRAIKELDKTLILVSNEVGMGVVPPTPLGRRYRDLLGVVNQRLARALDHVCLVVAGRPLVLKGGCPEEV